MSANAIETLREELTGLRSERVFHAYRCEKGHSFSAPSEGHRYCGLCGSVAKTTDDALDAAVAAVEALLEAAKDVTESKGSFGYPVFNATAVQALAAAVRRVETGQ